jgi:signal transduction histidine kinase
VGGLAQAILDSDDADALLSKVAQEARRLVSAKAAMVVTVGGNPTVMTVRALAGASGGPLAVGSTRAIADTAIDELVRAGAVMVTPAQADVPDSDRALLETYDVGPVVGVPIAAGGVVRGVLYVARAAKSDPFRQADIAMIATFAQQAASAVALIELRDTEARLTLDSERDRIARDLHDGLIQSLYGLGMSLRAGVARSPDERLASRVAESLARLDEAISAVREYIEQLGAGGGAGQPSVSSGTSRAAPVAPAQDGHDVIAALGSLAAATSASENLEEVLAELVSGVIERSRADFCVLGTLTDDSQGLRIRATGGSSVPGRQRGDTVPFDHTLTSEAIRRGRPVVFVTPDDASPAISAALREMGTGPVVAVPLSIRGRAFGGLAVGRLPGARRFSQRQVNLIEAHAVQAAIALEFDRVREEIRRAVVMEERRRVSHELHERVIQMLFGIGLSLQSLEGATRDAAMQASLDSAVDSIDEAIRDLRRYVFDLGPQPSGKRFDEQVSGMARDLVAPTALELSLDIDPDVSKIVDGAGPQILQIAREALSNVIRHADARHCVLRLRSQDGQILLAIADDGRGIQFSSPHGRGVPNMHARAVAIGGDVEIRPNGPNGTVVRLTVPIE